MGSPASSEISLSAVSFATSSHSIFHLGITSSSFFVNSATKEEEFRLFSLFSYTQYPLSFFQIFVA